MSLNTKFGFWFFGVLLGLVGCTAVALSHEAMSGWAYDTSCCSGQDCYQIRADSVRATPSGWLVPETNEVIPYGDKKLKVSGDGEFHRCSWQGDKAAATICLYVPAGG